MKLLLENWREYLNESYYHIARSKNIPLIMRDGLLPSKPTDMEDVDGVYLFKSRGAAEDALMNWLGDRFGEEARLTLLKVDPRGVDEVDSTAAGFEVVSTSKIDPQFVSVEQEDI